MLTLLFNLLYYLVSFVVAGFFLLLGVIGMLLPWSPNVRTELIMFILENSIAISLFGFVFVIVGMTLLINLSSITKRRYYYVRSGHRAIIVDEAILHHYLESYWKQLFPRHDVPHHLVIKKNKIRIVADLPYAHPDERKPILDRIQDELQDILTRVLGYSQELVLAVNFQTRQKDN